MSLIELIGLILLGTTRFDVIESANQVIITNCSAAEVVLQ